MFKELFLNNLPKQSVEQIRPHFSHWAEQRLYKRREQIEDKMAFEAKNVLNKHFIFKFVEFVWKIIKFMKNMR